MNLDAALEMEPSDDKKDQKLLDQARLNVIGAQMQLKMLQGPGPWEIRVNPNHPIETHIAVMKAMSSHGIYKGFFKKNILQWQVDEEKWAERKKAMDHIKSEQWIASVPSGW